MLTEICSVVYEYECSGHSFEILKSFTDENKAKEYLEIAMKDKNPDASWELWGIQYSNLET